MHFRKECNHHAIYIQGTIFVLKMHQLADYLTEASQNLQLFVSQIFVYPRTLDTIVGATHYFSFSRKCLFQRYVDNQEIIIIGIIKC